MWIYKITNIQNNKVYIGQSIRPVNQRFRRHINDAINNKLDTYFARAIRKYGKDNFYIKIIDKANNQEELNLKEIYWIKYYKATNEKYGYNETEALNKCGGNTYKHKNNQEMEQIKKKISKKKLEGLNPMARKIKRINIIDNSIEYFDSIIGCARDLGIKGGKTSITERLNGTIKKPYKNKYIFEYCDE